MKRFSKFIIPLAITLLVCGCAGKYSSRSNAAEETALFDTDVAFSKASEEKGAAEAFNMYLADRAIQLPAGSHPIIGKEAIYEDMKNSGDATLTWTPVKAEVSRSGDMGYTWGNYQVTVSGADGETRVGHGKYLNVWTKQPNGEWRVLIDMGNSNPPPEGTLTE